jgi:RNA polymerase sigma factor (sigma-70 family)
MGRTLGTTTAVTKAAVSSTLTLIRRGIEGDVAAWDEAFGRLLPRIHRWTHRRLSKRLRAIDDSMELVQSVLLAFWRNRRRVRLERDGDLDAYVRESVRRRIVNLARHAYRLPQLLPLDFELSAAEQCPIDTTIRGYDRHAVTSALTHLNERERALVIARFYMGYSHAQIGALCGLPSPDAARMAVNRALERLRHHLETKPL